LSTSLKNLSEELVTPPANSETYKIGIVRAEWNTPITGALEDAAIDYLNQAAIAPANITRITVPGSFELTTGAQLLLERGLLDAVICLGCVIQGETRHFDFICQAVANGLTNLAIQYKKPVIFGVLTTENLLQASERAGGRLGNKGREAALTAVKMVELFKTYKQAFKTTAGFK